MLVDRDNLDRDVGAALESEMKGRVPNPKLFVGWMASVDNESQQGEREIRARFDYFVSTVVRLSALVGEQIRILKAFWIAA